MIHNFFKILTFQSNSDTLGVDPRTLFNTSCTQIPSPLPTSIFKWAQNQGKRTGYIPFSTLRTKIIKLFYFEDL